MLDSPPMIAFLELRTCSVTIKGCRDLKWGTCSYSNTEQQYSIVARQREQALVQAKGTYVLGDTGADDLVAPLPCTVTAYFGKLAICDRAYEKGP